MNLRLVCVALLGLCSCRVVAADLSRVDRSVRREPAYRSTPRYCLLVFGPQAKQRVWLVLDGDTLYVDRNGNGDLTETGERLAIGKWQPLEAHPACAHEKRVQAGDLRVAGLTHTGLTVVQVQHRRKVDPACADARDWQEHVDRIWRQTGDGITFLVSLDLDGRCYGRFAAMGNRKIRHCSAAGWKGVLAFGRSRASAPVLHFGGPLTFRVSNSEVRRGKKEELTANLGTVGLGPGAFVVVDFELVPDDLGLNPVAEIAFPPRVRGRPPLIQKVRLDHRC